MVFRVTPNSLVETASANLAVRNSNLADLNRQLLTGNRVERPSDDPRTMQMLMRQSVVDDRFTTQLGMISSVTSTVNISVSELSAAQDVFTKARETVISANSATESSQGDTYALEVDALLNSLLTIANSQVGHRYLFGGTAIDRPPYLAEYAANGEIVSVTYQGTEKPMQVLIEPNTIVDATMSGAQAFHLTDRGITRIGPQTGVRPGTGTDSGHGLEQLTVGHLATTYSGASGLQPGSDSALKDNVVGNTHVVHVDDTSGDGSAGTISLNGGPVVSYSNLDTNLLVEGPKGEAVYVDTTGISAGFQGDVAVQASGTLSIDGGLSEVPITFENNQVITHAETGRTLTVNTSDVHATGTDFVEYEGTADAFETLISLRDDLRNSRNLDTSEWHDAISRRHADVDRTLQVITDAIATQSVQLANLESVDARIRDIQVTTQELIIELQSADAPTVAIRLQNEQNLLEFTLAASANLMGTSLIDFLR